MASAPGLLEQPRDATSRRAGPMATSLRPFALALGLAACFGADAITGPPWQSPLAVTRAEDGRPLRVLFIGNSLTFYNDLPARTTEIAARDLTLRVMETGQVVKGGASLRDHWATGTAQGRITGERWDYVVLQEGSTLYYDHPDSLESIVQRFDSVIRATGSRTVFYMTWPYQGSSLRQDSITRLVTRMAGRLHILVAPVGAAWATALAAIPGLSLYLPDGNHPAPVGTYLGACTMFATMFRRTPAGLAGLQAVGDTTVVQLDSATAAKLQQTAWSVTAPYLVH